MKSKLQIAMKACNSNGTQAEAAMVKFQNGKLIAYGGTFCLQIPISIGAECAFKPQTLLNRKDRTGASFTVKNGKLKVKHGSETVTMQCLSPEKLAIIDVFKEPKETPWIPAPALKALTLCVDSSHSMQALQGICVRDQEAIATNGRAVVAIPLDFGAAEFTIPMYTVAFLSTCDDKVTHYAFDETCLKLWMESGMTLCTRLISAEGFPDVDKILDQKDEAIVMNKGIKDELRTLKCDTIELTQKGIRYKVDSEGVGTIVCKSPKRYCFVMNKSTFDTILNINIGTKFFTSDNKDIIIGNGKDKFRSACSLLRTNPFITVRPSGDDDIPF